jgi:hypothetical protein
MNYPISQVGIDKTNNTPKYFQVAGRQPFKRRCQHWRLTMFEIYRKALQQKIDFYNSFGETSYYTLATCWDKTV